MQPLKINLLLLHNYARFILRGSCVKSNWSENYVVLKVLLYL